MLIWNFLISFCVFHAGQSFALLREHMEHKCGGYISNAESYRQVSFTYNSSNIAHRNCRVGINHGLPSLMNARLGGLIDNRGRGFLIVFEDVNLMDLECPKMNLSVTGVIMQGTNIEQPDTSIAGIPWPLCSGTVPWSEYPTPVIKAEDMVDLDIWFRAAPHTPSGAGFKLLIVDYYINGYGCQDGEFKCDNDLCLVKEVQNSDCDSIDWCMDNSGCGINVGLVAGLCGTLGALVLLAVIVLCIVWCCTKRGGLLRPNDQFWGVGSPSASGERYTLRDVAPAPYVEAARAAVRRAETQNPGTRSAQGLQPRSAYIGHTLTLETRQIEQDPGSMQRRPEREPSVDQQPPSYSSIWDSNDTQTEDNPQPWASAPTEVEQQTSLTAANIEEEYRTPPPTYETTVEYPEVYRITDREPAFV